MIQFQRRPDLETAASTQEYEDDNDDDNDEDSVGASNDDVTITPVIYDGIHRDSYRVLGQHLLGFNIENFSFLNF